MSRRCPASVCFCRRPFASPSITAIHIPLLAGYGDITPYTISEIAVTMLFEVVGGERARGAAAQPAWPPARACPFVRAICAGPRTCAGTEPAKVDAWLPAARCSPRPPPPLPNAQPLPRPWHAHAAQPLRRSSRLLRLYTQRHDQPADRLGPGGQACGGGAAETGGGSSLRPHPGVWPLQCRAVRHPPAPRGPGPRFCQASAAVPLAGITSSRGLARLLKRAAV
jgi:hypothetical protein